VEDPVAPVIPQNVPAARFAPQAFTADVNVRSGQIVITAPVAVRTATMSLSGPETPSLSLLGADAVRLVPTNFQVSDVGAFAPNKVRVTFDVTIENTLPNVAMTTPTWPPAPSPGVMLFPLDYVVTTAPDGGVTVEQAAGGAVMPSVDWNGNGAAGSGSPFSFFNDVGCTAAVTDECFRWEAYDLSIQPNTSSQTHTVGFDIDASVAQFRARMIVAADLVPAAVVSAVRVSGSVTSPTHGPIAGARITALTGHHVTTDSTGAYVLADLEAGAVMLTVSNLPAGCEVPPSRLLSIAAGDTAVVDFVVTCTAFTGMITGTLTSSTSGLPIAGATVASSTGGTAVSGASGAFMIGAAGSGTGTVTVTGLPAGCSVTAVPFVLQIGGALTLDLVADCASAAALPNQ
jgi:hypothetical protein